MLYPVTSSTQSMPIPNGPVASRQQLRPVKFGSNSHPTISSNPFVWLLNGIKSLHEMFSKTKVGQWLNRFFSRINQFLKAKPKEPHKPASPTPSPPPASTPTPPTAPSAPASAISPPAAPPEATPTQPVPITPTEPPGSSASPPPAVNEALHQHPMPHHPGPVQPPEPIVQAQPTVNPYSKLSLQELKKQQEQCLKRQKSLCAKQVALQDSLERLKSEHRKQSRRLEKVQRESVESLEESLAPDIEAAISLLEAKITTFTKEAEDLQSSLNKLNQQMPRIEYWLRLRKKLENARAR